MSIPPYVIAQLEKANDVIRRQSAELDHLRGSDREVENLALRTQLSEMDGKLRNYGNHFIERETLLVELNNVIESLSKDKNILQEKYLKMERKYKKAKAASKEFARIIEGSSVVKDVHMHSSSLLEQSRAKHDTNPQNDELKETGNLPCEKTTVNTIALQIELENSLLDMENLKSELQKERQFSKSLHDDLDANRKLVLSRDAEIIELTSKLSECERKLKQCEDHLSCTSTDLALERARCDEVMLSLQESETLLSQARSDGLSYILDNQRLIEESREAAQLIVSLQAKLDAQGQDLISTKKALHSLQRAKDEHLLLNTESHH